MVNKPKAALTFKLDSISLSPSSCNGLICLPTGEVQFRVHASGSNIKSAPRSCVQDSLRLQSDLVKRIKETHPYCAFCGLQLIDTNRKFHRVLPLPSENWSDYADIWFCCKSKHKLSHSTEADECESTIGMKTLQPHPGDCLVGSLYFLVHKEFLTGGSYDVTDDQTVQCRRCKNRLGTVWESRVLKQKVMMNGPERCNSEDSGMLKIMTHAVTFHLEEEEKSNNDSDRDRNATSSKLSTELFLSRYLLEESRLYTSFRFIVESEQRKPLLKCLIWLLDSDALIFHACGTPSIPSSSIQVQKSQVLKILYTVHLSQSSAEKTTNESELLELWQKDSTVHCCSLPHELCLSLIKCLIHSTKRLPASLRYLNGLHVGFLHKEGGSR